MTDNEINEQMARDPEAYGRSPYSSCAYERKVVSDVLDAWIKQREKGFTLLHDLTHVDGELSRAAAAYALHGAPALSSPQTMPFHQWPWPHDNSWKPKSRRENLLRAAAFLLSEIVRLDAETEHDEHKRKTI